MSYEANIVRADGTMMRPPAGCAIAFERPTATRGGYELALYVDSERVVWARIRDRDLALRVHEAGQVRFLKRVEDLDAREVLADMGYDAAEALHEAPLRRGAA